MLGLNIRKIVEILSYPQNIYDGVILGLNYMPTKLVAAATAAIVSGTALYLAQPENLPTQISVIIITSGLAWAATEAAHQIGSKLWKKRLAELDANNKEDEKTPEAIEIKRKMEEMNRKYLDNLFADPEFLKEFSLGNNLNPTITNTQ